MHQQPLERDQDDGSSLFETIDTLKDDMYDKLTICRSKIEMRSELLDQSVDTIKSAFEDLHAMLKKREDALIDALKVAEIDSVKSQEKFIKDAEAFRDSVYDIEDEIKQQVPTDNQIAVNAYRRRLEAMSGQLKGMLGYVFEPVFERTTREERILEGLRVGHVKTTSLFTRGGETDANAIANYEEDGATPNPVLKVGDTGTFSLHRPGVDQNESIITSIVWKNGKIVATDKSNKKLKFFTEDGQFLHDIIFSNAEPYCVASVDNVVEINDGVEKFCVTFPKVKYLYFVCYESQVKDKPPTIWFYLQTQVGYSGVSAGIVKNQILCTVVCNSGDPRVDIVDFQGNVLKTVGIDCLGSRRRSIFNFPRYILTNSNAIIVSDYKMNEVSFLDYNGVVLGQYRGVRGHPLVNPYDITVDGEGNVYVMDGKTGDVHVTDARFKTISIIRCGAKLLRPRLLEYDTITNRLAITHGAGDVTIYPVTPNYTIEEFGTRERTHNGSMEKLAPGEGSPTIKRRSWAGSEGLLMAPQDINGRASPGF